MASTNIRQPRDIAMKQLAFKHLTLIGSLLAASSASAASYEYTNRFDYVGKPALAESQVDAQLQADTATCDATVGVQDAIPLARYRACMLQHRWKYRSSTRSKVRAPADPYYSANVKLKPGHFIDHDTGLDCQSMGGAWVCEAPTGTVHYFDPKEGLPCTRTGALSICSNINIR